jgi:exosortase family protein XrtF
MIRQYREAIIFLVKYLGVYVILNTAYSFYVKHYLPAPDPATIAVTATVTGILNIADSTVAYIVPITSANVPVTRSGVTIVEVFEGCNSINVIIVYIAFLVAFKGPLKLFFKYMLVGVISIFAINLLRVLALYEVALYFPEKLYFFHKFFFTGIIYAFVFMLWFLWVNAIKKWNLHSEAN